MDEQDHAGIGERIIGRDQEIDDPAQSMLLIKILFQLMANPQFRGRH